MAFEYVVQHPRLLDHRDCAGRTPLMKAAQQGASRHVVALLAARADPNMRGGNGWTVLHYAAVSSCAELCDILIDQPRFPWRPSRTKRRRCSTCAAARGRSRDPVPTKPALEAYTEPSTRSTSLEVLYFTPPYLTLLRFLPIFTDFSDFLGRLHAADPMTLDTLGVE